MKALLYHLRKISIGGVVGGCFIVTMVGCSSRLNTTVMSGTQPSEPQAVVESEPVVAPVKKAEILQPKIQEPIDIPVEEPARATIHSAKPAEIFAASPSEGAKSQIAETPATEPEPVLDVTTASVPRMTPEEPQAGEIPPIVFEPELPAVPTLRERVVAPQELEMKSEPERVEKVAPPQERVAMVVPEQKEDVPHVPSSEVPKVQEAEPTSEPMEVAKVISPPEIVETVLKPLRDVYFDYDRFTIRPDAVPVLKDNSQSLVAGLTGKQIVIEGHCDERGTSSYNIVLGERRAQAVKEYLIDLGVPADKLQTVSYGKERPFCLEQTEACWQENRRGHFVLK